MGNRILVAYASRCGSTGEVADVVAEVLREAGAEVDVSHLDRIPDLEGYDSVIIGSAVRMMRILPETVRFVKAHRVELQQVPVAYFEVCMTMKDDTPENRKVAEGYLEPLRRVREPISTGVFPGAIELAKLSPLLRFFLSRANEVPKGDFRDWDAVRTWARQLAPLVVRAS